MKIGFSGLALQPNASRRGVDNYTYQLMRVLPHVRTQDRFVYFVWDDNHDFDDLADDQVELLRLPLVDRPRQARLASRIVAEQFIMPALARAHHLDLLHFPDNTIPVVASAGVPVTMTLHDLMVFTHPEAMGGFTRAYKARTAAPSIHKADAIVCDSSFSRDELQRMFPAAAVKTQVVHLAPAQHYRPLPESQVQRALAARGLDTEGYFLYLGPVEYRKNVDGLINAYAQAATLASLPPLVIAGKIALFAEEIAALPAQLGIADRVHFLGYVSDDEAVALYNGALSVVYPSWFEGFGLPILEAMRCNAPVITSNRSSMPEIAGDAAILIDPDDGESLTAALILVASQPALRQAMRAAGATWVQRFGWEQCARETAQVWDAVMQAHGA